MNLKEIAAKWQEKWEKDKVFQVEADDDRKKYYVTTAYPYMNGILHLGHLFTYIAPEVVSRYKRMKGFNVLFKFGFHCTGTPLVAAAQRIKEKEPKQIEILRQMEIPEKEISKFANSEYWAEYFPEQTKKDLRNIGFAVDERYMFKTTSLNPAYDAFIRWQFLRLKDKGYVKKGKHPVVWCPKDNLPVGDHDRLEGEGETPQEFLLFKHKLDDGRFVISATLRYDTVLGITNLFVGPEQEYCEADVDGEIWILGEKSANNLRDQGYEVKINKKIFGKELIGKQTSEFDGSKVLILPASFLDPNFGTALVHSVPSDSSDDLVALQDLQRDEETCKRYGLDIEEVKQIDPKPVLNTPGMGEIPAEKMLEKYAVKSQKEVSKLEKIKKELYKLSHYTATFNERYKKLFSKDLEGKKVEEGKPIIRKDLIEKGFAVPYYELTGKVVCRCLKECIVKIVENQWFIEYNDPKWKELTHKCLDKMILYPDKARKQFEYVLDWLDHWACTREFGLGTKLPWDMTWVIESLSDSTLQMAYCTISKYLEHPKEYGFSVNQLSEELFDYVFLGKGTLAAVVQSTGISEEIIGKMTKDFNYWYPFDLRTSAKDLIQNHLAFCLFNHTALFPEKHWPLGYLLNGRVMVNNEKMAKSKGNFFTVRELYEKHGADVIRLTAANAGEGIDDANYDMAFLETAKNKLLDLARFIHENYGKGRTKKLHIDEWFEQIINKCVKGTTKALEEMLFKTAVKNSFLDMNRYLKWYTRRTRGDYNKTVINKFIEVQLMLLTPFTPFFCEEIWEKIKGEGYISNAKWPKLWKIDTKMLKGEELIETVLKDVQVVLKLTKIEKLKKIELFVSEDWKHGLFKEIGKQLEKTRDFKEIITALMKKEELKKHAQYITKILPKMIKMGAPETTSQKFELGILEDAKEFLEKEYGCSIKIIKEQETKEVKAKQAMPGKPAILVEG